MKIGGRIQNGMNFPLTNSTYTENTLLIYLYRFLLIHFFPSDSKSTKKIFDATIFDNFPFTSNLR